MLKINKKTISILILMLFCWQIHSRPLVLRIAAVQLSIGPELYYSELSFQREVTRLVAESETACNADLIIFPEYTGVFLAMVPYAYYIYSSASYLECMNKIVADKPQIDSIRTLFIKQSAYVTGVVNRVFGNLARKYRTTIISGTSFYFDGKRLTNRALVFTPRGEIDYWQDKVYLTDFEKDIVQLDAGKSADARVFTVEGFELFLTICRDSFFSDWRPQHADLWIDIKANGTAFTPDEQVLFLQAVPARLLEYSLLAGLTVCLTGKYRDLYWEGRSSFVVRSGSEVKAVQEAQTVSGEEIIYLTLTKE